MEAAELAEQKAAADPAKPDDEFEPTPEEVAIESESDDFDTDVEVAAEEQEL